MYAQLKRGQFPSNKILKEKIMKYIKSLDNIITDWLPLWPILKFKVVKFFTGAATTEVQEVEKGEEDGNL